MTATSKGLHCRLLWVIQYCIKLTSQSEKALHHRFCVILIEINVFVSDARHILRCILLRVLIISKSIGSILSADDYKL